MKRGEGKGNEETGRQERGRKGLCRRMEELFASRDSDSAKRAGKAYSHGKRFSQNWPLRRMRPVSEPWVLKILSHLSHGGLEKIK